MTSSDGLSPSKATLKTRFATPADEDRVLEMAKDFFNYSVYSGVQFDEEAIRVLIKELTATGCLILSERGFIAGALTPLFFAPNVMVASEIVWWAPDEGGLELREAFEAWAVSQGASAIKMSTLSNGIAKKLSVNLTTNGYTPVEIHYLKALD